MRNATSQLVKTAILIALLLVCQYVGFFGGVKPVIVNFILAFSAFYLELKYSIFVAALSPILAFFLGFGGLPLGLNMLFPLIPAIMIANAVLVVSCSMFYHKSEKLVMRLVGCTIGSFFKFIVLWISVAVLLPYFVALPHEKLSKIIMLFSFPQFVFAIIGSVFALLLIVFYPHITKNA